MDAALLVCLLDLALIGALPRVFFRPGRLNLRWWLTAAPFFLAGGLLLLGAFGELEPRLPAGVVSSTRLVAPVLAAASIGLIGFAAGSHAEPVSLWHQPADTPARLATGGAYARVRHPFYAAFLLGLLGCVAALPVVPMAVVFLLAWLQLDRTAAREETRLLRSAHAAEYRAYLRRSGRFLPRVRRP